MSILWYKSTDTGHPVPVVGNIREGGAGMQHASVTTEFIVRFPTQEHVPTLFLNFCGSADNLPYVRVAYHQPWHTTQSPFYAKYLRLCKSMVSYSRFFFTI